MNAILYVCRTGIPWEYLPHDFPPYKTVYDYYDKWEADGTTETLYDLLRQQMCWGYCLSRSPLRCLCKFRGGQAAWRPRHRSPGAGMLTFNRAGASTDLDYSRIESRGEYVR